MARGRKAKQSSAAAGLQKALDFCSVAYREIGAEYQTHVVLHAGWVFAFDGVIAAGHRTDDGPSAAPCGHLLRLAIDRAGPLSLGLADGALAVSCGGFRARVPCIPLESVQPFAPDPARLPAPGLKEAFGSVAHIAANSGATVVESSLLLADNVITATNLKIVMQYWHGLDFGDTVFAVPRQLATAVLKATEPVTSVGWSDRTFTVYFESGAWLRSQLYSEEWPNVEKVFERRDASVIPQPLPADFFDAVSAVLPFAGELGHIRLEQDMVVCDNASQQCKGIPQFGEVVALSGALLKHIAGRVNAVDWISDNRAVHFFGDSMRAGVIRLTS